MMLTLITGGARSGKSERALALAAPSAPRVFVATATALDAEMRERIVRHRERRGTDWHTVEAPYDLGPALAALSPATGVAVVDCLTVWLGNLVHRHGVEREGFPEIDEFLAVLDRPPCPLIVVTNEIGQGLVPENPVARRFRDLAGRLNQHVAARADRVEFCVCGLPVAVKDAAS